MKSQTKIRIAAVIGVLAVAAPIGASLYLAERQSLSEQKEKVDRISSEVLQRMDHMADETFTMFRLMKEASATDPCADENIRRMRRIVMRMDHLKAVGYVRDNLLICSSFGRHDIDRAGIPLGQVSYKSPMGSEVRTYVTFDSVPNRTFLTSTDASTGYTAIIQADQALLMNLPGISTGVFFGSTKTPLVYNGMFLPHWMTIPGKEKEKLFISDEYLIAFKRSQTYTFAAFAAIRHEAISEGTSHAAMLMIPAGSIAGVVLAIMVFLITRYQLSTRILIKEGLRRKEFFLMYQPIIRVSDGKCVGAEALIRWRTSDGQLVPPDNFIPVAEESDLIHEMTAEVMRLVAQDTANLLQMRPDLHISINLSPKDLMRESTIHALDTLITDMQVLPTNIIVEATERGIMQADIARDIMDQIHDLKMPIAIDDFGTGYSSLSCLNDFKLDYLKIDKSFVQTMGGEAATSQVVKHIIDMARSLNLEMIAEGVETEEQLNYLKLHGVQYAQGYLFAKPLPLAEFIRFVEQNTDNL